MEHPLHYAIGYDLKVIKLGYFNGNLEDARWLARGYATAKNIKYMKVVNHTELVTLYNNIDAATLVTLYNNIDAATSDPLSGQPFT